MAAITGIALSEILPMSARRLLSGKPDIGADMARRQGRAFVVHSDREDVALSVALGFSQEHVGVRVKYCDGSLVD
jgi:hypothetical protein